jgi:hypothetical protein
MGRRVVVLLLALLFPVLGRAAEKGQWIVVTAPAYRKALAPLVKHRKAEGLRVKVVETAGESAQKLRDRVHKLCKAHEGPSYVLLVGAIKGRVPALTGTVGRMKGEPTDNGYGCPKGSRLPTVAVGRFPARSVTEAEAMVARTLAYEADGPGEWKRRLTVLAGIPAYNPLVDRLVESLAMARFARLDPAWTGRAIYTNPASPFCVPDKQLRTRATGYVQEGQAFVLYLGHSNPLGLYGGRARFLDRDDWARLKIPSGRGVFFTFGCNGCQLAGRGGEGYGVAAMRNPSGPAAVVGSHGICFAAMVQLAADGLFASTFTSKVPARLGESWLALEKGVAEGKIDDFTYNLLNGVDGDPKIPQAVQRQEHLEMFLLLGDPALRLPDLADDLTLKIPARARPGERLLVGGQLPARLEGARVRVTLERRVSARPADLKRLPAEGDAGRDAVMQANHERANRFVLASAEVKAGREFSARLGVPGKAPWRDVIVRVYARKGEAEGMKAVAVPVAGKE